MILWICPNGSMDLQIFVSADPCLTTRAPSSNGTKSYFKREKSVKLQVVLLESHRPKRGADERRRLDACRLFTDQQARHRGTR